PDDVNAGKAERLDRIEVAIGEVGDVIEPGGRLGTAEAGMIGRDHVEALRQGVEQNRPLGKPIRAVQVNQRRALPAAGKAKLAAVDLDGVPDKLHGIPPPCRCALKKIREVAEALKRFLRLWRCAMTLPAGSRSPAARSRRQPDNARVSGGHHIYAPKARVHLAHLRFSY